ncbi:MAG: DUF1684 domain-containing protein [Verrucomicrobia bacterium]|nr:DUF1684 domain-containing protein [Verrucomicrobiota bacterium]
MLTTNPGLMHNRILISLGLLLAACSTPQRSARNDIYRAELESWKTRRREAIAGTNGWTTVVGLHWLAPGANSIGTNATNTIVLPTGRAPIRAGTLWRSGNEARFETVPGVVALLDGAPVQSAVLRSDANGTKPSVLALGGLRMFVIERGERLGLRVRDENSPARLAFRELNYFAVDPRWRLAARFEPYSLPRHLRIADVTGAVNDELCPGAVVFSARGREHRLDVMEDEPGGDFLIVFRDTTAGKSTYDAGRFLKLPRPNAAGQTVIDFNRAYNPPCAFTDFATCPLPLRQNQLPFAIEAGERKYAGSH